MPVSGSSIGPNIKAPDRSTYASVLYVHSLMLSALKGDGIFSLYSFTVAEIESHFPLMKPGMCSIFPDSYFFVFPLDSNLLTWTRQKDIQSDGKLVLSISTRCVFQKKMFSNVIELVISIGPSGVEVMEYRASDFKIGRAQIEITSTTYLWIVRREAQLLLINHGISTANNFSEAKNSIEFFMC